jgi:hypothetical protein
LEVAALETVDERAGVLFRLAWRRVPNVAALNPFPLNLGIFVKNVLKLDGRNFVGLLNQFGGCGAAGGAWGCISLILPKWMRYLASVVPDKAV